MTRTRSGPTTLVLLFVGLGSLGGVRRVEADTAHVLTLDQALAMARQKSPTLTAERERLAQAQSNLDQAWSVLFPTVAAQGKYTRNNVGVVFNLPAQGGGPAGPATIQPLNQLDGAINFSTPLLIPYAYPGLKAVKAEGDAAEASYEVSLTTVLFAVAQAYYAAAITDEVLTARQSSIEVARATLSNAEARFSAGTVTKVDVDRAELAVVRAEQAAREARFAQEQSYRALATLIQSESGFKVELTAPAPRAAEAEPDVNLVLHLRPEFRALELSARSELSQQDVYAWKWAPTLSGFGSARIFNYDNFARQRHAWAVGLQLDWVLFDGGLRDAQRHLAASQAREAMARAQVLRDSIRDDLANTRGLLETKRRAQEAAERSVALAEETLDLLRTQYEAGNIAQIDLLQAQDGLVAAKEALAQSHFEVAVADLSLRRADGTFPGK